MSKVTLEFDVDQLAGYYEPDTGYSEIETVEGAIISAAARHLLSEYNERINAGITAKINQFITETIESNVRERVNQMVADTFESEYPVLNTYGKPSGETTSIIAQVETMLDRIVNEKVDYKGNRQDGYGNRNDKTRWEWHVETFITDKVDREFKRHLEAVVKSAQQAAKERIAEKILELGK